jgi:N-acetylglucosamine kinase-like BadF-type ATPase
MARPVAQTLTAMETLLAIDGGGSRTRCLAITREGRVIGSAESGASNHLLVGIDVVEASLHEAINSALAQAGAKRTEAICVSAGLAGVDYDGNGAAEMERLLNRFGFAHTVINGDMVIAHVGALGSRPGVLALAGTGSVILGIGPAGERVKVGGWGPVYGDEGSAYQIARMALIAAARAYDGRGPETSLLEGISQTLGLQDFRETVSRIYVQKMESREIAELSRVTYETAESGDRVAQGIFLHAAGDLAEAVGIAIRKLNLAGERLVSYQGSILSGCALVRERFSELLQQEFPGIAIRAPRFAPVIGAYLLGCTALGWTFPVEQESNLRKIAV